MKKLILALLAVFTVATSASAQQCSSCESKSVSANEGQPTIVEVAASAGKFETLLKAAEVAGLVDTLNGAGPYTVFAPTDEAFAKLPEGTVESLLNDPKKLSQVLLYHVVPGNLKATDVLGKKTLTSAQGAPISVTTKGGKAMVNQAVIIGTDVPASNGVIHIIDAVILPPQ